MTEGRRRRLTCEFRTPTKKRTAARNIRFWHAQAAKQRAAPIHHLSRSTGWGFLEHFAGGTTTAAGHGHAVGAATLTGATPCEQSGPPTSAGQTHGHRGPFPWTSIADPATRAGGRGSSSRAAPASWRRGAGRAPSPRDSSPRPLRRPRRRRHAARRGDAAARAGASARRERRRGHPRWSRDRRRRHPPRAAPPPGSRGRVRARGGFRWPQPLGARRGAARFPRRSVPGARTAGPQSRLPMHCGRGVAARQ